MNRVKAFVAGFKAGRHLHESESANNRAHSGPQASDYLFGALVILVSIVATVLCGMRGSIALPEALLFGFCFFFGLSLLARRRWPLDAWLRVTAGAFFLASLVAELIVTGRPNWVLILAAVFLGVAFVHAFYEAARRRA